MEPTNTEKITERMRELIREASKLGVNLYTVVQGNPQREVFYAYPTVRREDLGHFVEKTIEHFRENNGQLDKLQVHVPGSEIGWISYKPGSEEHLEFSFLTKKP